ncbi:hypothetical protein GCM10027521_20700 [Amycolatopsis cihanbeyliensis]
MPLAGPDPVHHPVEPAHRLAVCVEKLHSSTASRSRPTRTFVLKAVDPAANHSTCYVSTDEVDALYQAFTEGLRATSARCPPAASRGSIR